MPTTLYAPSATRNAQLRILVADDNNMFAAAVQRLLGRLGHSVEVVGNGREAVEAASRAEFDFVFLDIQMPEMGGFEAASSIRQSISAASPPRIIGLSAQDDYRDAKTTAGMDDFLIKPVRFEDLVGVLDRFASH